MGYHTFPVRVLEAAVAQLAPPKGRTDMLLTVRAVIAHPRRRLVVALCTRRDVRVFVVPLVSGAMELDETIFAVRVRGSEHSKSVLV